MRNELKNYDVWFQDGHIMFTVRALNSQEARRIAIKFISIKEHKDENDAKDEVGEKK